jgi:murein DD-endopeptidase MepM/ murein hydrolase activator NlpD
MVLDTDLDNLITEVAQLFNNKESFNPSNSSNLDQFVSQFQAPIKGVFYNSGDFSPGIATDTRHSKGHDGVDLRATGGTPVYPMTIGVVSNVGSSSVGGNTISIVHPSGIKTYYAHLGTIKVHKGDKVNLNSIIGTVGDSGNAKGTFPHIHFQVWKNGKLENPANYFHIPAYTPASKKEVAWLSEEEKEKAKSFNMINHLNNHKLAFSKEVEKLLKLAHQYKIMADK